MVPSVIICQPDCIKTGKAENSFADTEISEKWGFLRDTTVTTGIVMVVIYLVCSIVAGSAYISTITEQNMVIFSILTGLQFAVGVAIVYSGVRLIWVTSYLRSGYQPETDPELNSGG